MKLRSLAASLALALPLAAGCRSDESLNAPDLSTSRGLLQRYVAMGNSVTAGFQSGGINDSTQLQSYAVVFARQAGAPFFPPLLNRPGCPAPFVINSTNPPTRLGGAGPGDCALRNGSPGPYVSNVAVPGVIVAGLLDNRITANPLTQFILGGRTQVRAMMDAQPTFVTLWVGNNDVLGALTSTANPGDPALITPEAAFETAYGAVLDSIARTGAKAALIGVADVTVIPYTSSGATYWCIKNQPACGFTAPPFPPTFSVSNNCAPAAAIPGAKGDSILVPWVVGIPRLSAAAGGTPTALDCSVDADVVLPAEFAALRNAVQAHNAYIAAQAQQRGWAYLDVNPTLLALKADPSKIASFPTPPSGPGQPNVLFGSLFSLDGVHPSAAAHRIVADSLIAVVNRTYGTTIPFAGP